MDEKEAEARPLMGTIFLVVIPWVVGVYQNKCPCHEGAARVTRAQPECQGVYSDISRQ